MLKTGGLHPPDVKEQRIEVKVRCALCGRHVAVGDTRVLGASYHCRPCYAYILAKAVRD
jgi:formylmethanofuran dehydrogenase subunit E